LENRCRSGRSDGVVKKHLSTDGLHSKRKPGLLVNEKQKALIGLQQTVQSGHSEPRNTFE
jgi:hypothetical protein